MKMTIETLRKKYQSAEANAAAREEEIKQAEADLALLKAQQEDAAANGNVEAYNALDDDIRKATNRITVLVKSAAASEKITPEDAANAWREYADAASKAQRKRIADYDQCVKDLADKYEACLIGQNEFLQTREEIGAMAGMFFGDFDSRAKLHRQFPLPVELPGAGLDTDLRRFPELCFFRDRVCNDPELAEVINNVVRLQNATGPIKIRHN